MHFEHTLTLSLKSVREEPFQFRRMNDLAMAVVFLLLPGAVAHWTQQTTLLVTSNVRQIEMSANDTSILSFRFRLRRNLEQSREHNELARHHYVCKQFSSCNSSFSRSYLELCRPRRNMDVPLALKTGSTSLPCLQTVLSVKRAVTAHDEDKLW